MTSPLFVKTYPDPVRRAAAQAHLRWLAGLDAGVRLPHLRTAGERTLVFEYLGNRHPQPENLPALAEALGRLHTAAHRQHLHAAHLDRPYTCATLTIRDFHTPRASILQRIPVDLTGLPVAFYKDANPRNFLLTDAGVAVIDFDDLTLAPFGYDLAKLVVTTAMTHGNLDTSLITDTLSAYNTATATIPAAACTPTQLWTYTEIHHALTARYLHRNGYRHAWPDVRPLPTQHPAPRSPLGAADGHHR